MRTRDVISLEMCITYEKEKRGGFMCRAHPLRLLQVTSGAKHRESLPSSDDTLSSYLSQEAIPFTSYKLQVARITVRITVRISPFI